MKIPRHSPQFIGENGWFDANSFRKSCYAQNENRKANKGEYN